MSSSKKDNPDNKADESRDPWGLGNRVLYNLCKKYPLDFQNKKYSNEEILASEMWLIGRSYAASPERYRYGSGYSKPKITDKGYETFFSVVAKNLIEGKDKDKWVKFIERLNTSKTKHSKRSGGYSLSSDSKKPCKEDAETNKEFTLCEKDEETIKESIVLVFSFLELLRSARAQRDFNEKPPESFKDFEDFKAADFFGQSYPLSFSSKFLHFHLPETVFIFDAITSDHLKKKKIGDLEFDKDEFESAKEEGERIAAELLEDEGEINRLFKEYKDENEELPSRLKDKVEDYTKHSSLSYAVARKHLPKMSKEKIPRAVDILVSNPEKLESFRRYGFLTQA